MIIIEPDRRLQILRPKDNSDIPKCTQLVARNAFPKESVIMTRRDELDLIFEDKEFGLTPI